MNIVIIATIVVLAIAVAGILLATLFVRLSNTVSHNQTEIAEVMTAFNQNLTAGHKIPVEADFQTQLAAAQIQAARLAAARPRGANSLFVDGNKASGTAFDGVKDDPLTAVRIANFHGWQFLRGPGAVTGQPVAAAASPAQVAPPVKSKSPDDLEPGVDYPVIEITDDMDPAAIRKARIANAKAKSAAIKELKESGAAAAPAAVATAPAVAPASAPAAPAGAVSEPVAGVDYEEIAITDDMDPAEIRKARIANAKAKSAAMKNFKEAGGVVGQEAPVAEAAPAAAQAAAAPAPAAPPASIPQPEYIEITDDMDPADVRKARIANAKAKSAYNKALKEAGIDPSTVDA